MIDRARRSVLGILLAACSAASCGGGSGSDASGGEGGGEGGAMPSADATAAADTGAPDADASMGGDDAPIPKGRDGGVVPSDAGAFGPIDLSSAMIYAVYPSIFSPTGTLAEVTAQLPRIHGLGFNVLWLMPVTPVGQPTGGHPAYGSPYCVHDYASINPAYGSPADLAALVQAAHAQGVRVILDEVLNHTAWDSPLLTEHPEYYLHSDGNPQNVASIEQAFTFPDVAQLDYKSDNGLAKYVTSMLATWVTTYDLDGFRFDTADNPYGDGRMIPASFWQGLAASLDGVKKGLLLLGEEQDPALAEAPFQLDYGWTLQGQFGAGGLKQVASGAAATMMQQAWTAQTAGEPAAMRHMTLLQDWDMDEDLRVYGGPAQTMAAATFNFTIDGVPLLFNGEEAGNDQSGNNTHAVIDWTGPNAGAFTSFYASLLALRSGATALQRGAVTWLTNGAPSQLVSFTRSDATGTYLVLVSFSASALTTTVAAPSVSAWSDVSPAGSPGGQAHVAPPGVSLAPYDFAVFRANQ